MTRGIQLFSTVVPDGRLELSLNETTFPDPGDDEVLVEVKAAPINPADLLVMFGPADLSTIEVIGSRSISAKIDASRMPSLAARAGRPIAIGNEGAGVVVKAGKQAAQLEGAMVAVRNGMFSQYKIAKASDCMVLNPGTTAVQGASASINPLTALCMIENMRRDGSAGLVHTAAASSVGQILARICLTDDIPLVNIVRSRSQVDLLTKVGSPHVLDSNSADFLTHLEGALDVTKATVAFDAIGGGSMASDILAAMETVAVRNTAVFNRYGSTTMKRVYVYGLLNPGPRIVNTNVGTAWSIAGWLMSWYLDSIGELEARRLKKRIVDEIATTFATSYSAEIGLDDILDPNIIAGFTKKATGEKYLVKPTG